MFGLSLTVKPEATLLPYLTVTLFSAFAAALVIFIRNRYVLAAPQKQQAGSSETVNPVSGNNIFFSSNYTAEDENRRINSNDKNTDILTQDETELLMKEQRFESIFENIKTGIVTLDARGKIVRANTGIERMLGFKVQELRSKYFPELIHLEENESGNGLVLDMVSGKQQYLDIETRLQDKQGQLIWCRVVWGLVKNGERQPFSIAFIDDITERKEAEKMKDAFIDMVAHELKNPLMAVISSLRLAKKQGQFPDVLNELIGIASDGAESVWSILENMLEVSRARAGRLKLSPVDSDIKQIIGDVVTGSQHTLIHWINTDIPENLPRVIVDPARIQLILHNLVDNAIKYSPKGGEILVFARQVDKELVVGVKDHGIGISKSQQQNLFQPFERLGAKNTVGSGLGLAVCRLLVTCHNGHIWVESEPGQGSTFCFALPLDHEEP